MKGRQHSNNVIRDCASLSSGTLGTLTGKRKYEELEKVQAELVKLAIEMQNAAKTWMDVWKEYATRQQDKEEVISIDR